MRRRTAYMALSFFCITAGCKDKGAAASEAAPPPAASVAPDLKAIARSVVTRTVGIKEGDIVTVIGSPRDLELLEDIVIEVQKAGGRVLPIITSERMARMSFDEVPAKYDSEMGVWPAIITSNVTAQITIDGVETPDLLANVPAERIATRSTATLEATANFYRRGVRSVDIGNGMYPTHAAAAMYGISRDQLATFFWSALNADFADIRTNARIIQDALANAKEVHITDANGTDLRVGITGQKWRVSDGVMTEENIKNKDVQKYLPAGELYSLVDPGSAEGTIVADHYPYQGKNITGLTLKLSKGKVVSMTGSPEVARLKKSFDAESHPRKAEITVLDFGLNPGIRATAAKTLRTWVPEGMVTISVGNDVWVGGSNNSPFGAGIFLASATVTADGKVIIENGNIKR